MENFIMSKSEKNTVLFRNAKGEASRSPQADGIIIDITLANGFNLEVDTSKLSAEVKHQAMLHGLKQKHMDSVAGKSGAEAWDALAATATMLQAGDWTRAKEASGGTNTTLLSEALMRLYKKTANEVRDALEARSDDEVKEMAKMPQVAAVILTLKAERAAAKAEAASGTDVTDSFNPFTE